MYKDEGLINNSVLFKTPKISRTVLMQKKVHPSTIWSAVKLGIYNAYGPTPSSSSSLTSNVTPTAAELNVHFASIASVRTSTSSSTIRMSPVEAAIDVLSLQPISGPFDLFKSHLTP